MSDEPRIAHLDDGLSALEADLDKIEAELDREDRELLGESEPKTWTTDQMIEQLGKVGIDVKKFKTAGAELDTRRSIRGAQEARRHRRRLQTAGRLAVSASADDQR